MSITYVCMYLNCYTVRFIAPMAMFIFSPVSWHSSNGMRMRVCVRMRVDGINLKYALCWHINIPVHSILCQCIHTSMHTHTLKSFEDGEPMGLKVHIAAPIAEVVHVNKKDDTGSLSETVYQYCDIVPKNLNALKLLICKFT